MKIYFKKDPLTLVDKVPLVSNILVYGQNFSVPKKWAKTTQHTTGKDQRNFTFNPMEICNAAGVNYFEVEQGLQMLRNAGDATFSQSNPAYHLKLLRQITAEEFADLLRTAANNVTAIERSGVHKVDKIWAILSKVAVDHRPQPASNAAGEMVNTGEGLEEDTAQEELLGPEQGPETAGPLEDSTDTINELVREYFEGYVDFHSEPPPSVSDENLL